MRRRFSALWARLAGPRGALGLVLALALAMLQASCAHSKIADTNIDDTPENREILHVVEAYQSAMQSRDADALLSLVSPNYFEDNGNTDRSDDYDYEGLKANLAKDFHRTKAMQLVVRVDDIKVDNNKAYAEIYYQYRAQNEYPSGLQWDTGSDRARLRLEKDEGKWRIIAGL